MELFRGRVLQDLYKGYDFLGLTFWDVAKLIHCRCNPVLNRVEM